ncbi:hypothetical protein TSAR_009258 [Trichomalopsis sarcophagae]|uniref:Uncharacterized protein n=1 Tax=Trichomalopsis sarcophagae TaxID=543379 RepID=A0A232ESF7_9HYME|nr:hypothetical protein TSAR_009258 [Trichomalopsis sarcophagae]
MRSKISMRCLFLIFVILLAINTAYGLEKHSTLCRKYGVNCGFNPHKWSIYPKMVNPDAQERISSTVVPSVNTIP